MNTIATLMANTNITRTELTEMAIWRLISNDAESAGLFQEYTNDVDANGNFESEAEEADYGEFGAWLTACYSDLDTENVELRILENLAHNYHYLD